MISNHLSTHIYIDFVKGKIVFSREFEFPPKKLNKAHMESPKGKGKNSTGSPTNRAMIRIETRKCQLDQKVTDFLIQLKGK